MATTQVRVPPSPVTPTRDPARAADPTVEVRRVSKWFGTKVAVSDVSCSFGPGITGLLGPNGAGKTTLLRMITGLLHPSEGGVSVFGTDPLKDPAVYRRIGFVPKTTPSMATSPFVSSFATRPSLAGTTHRPRSSTRRSRR